MIKGLIFDFDGTIIDTETPWYYAFDEIYRHFDIEFPLSLWLANIGSATQKFDPIHYLQCETCTCLNDSEIQVLAQEFYQQYKRKSGLIPGIKEFIHQATHRGLKLAIASCATYDWVYGHLIDYDLIDYFPIILTIEDIHHEKPDPEIYKKAIEKMCFDIRDLIALEDSTYGIDAATDAGLFTIGINSPFIKNEHMYKCHIIIENYHLASLDNIILAANRYYLK